MIFFICINKIIKIINLLHSL